MLVCGTYAVLHSIAPQAGSTFLGLKTALSPVWRLGIAGTKAFSGFGGLAFYYYDLISGLIVLCQVWDTWPGLFLAIIYVFHFTAVGAIVAFHGLCRLGMLGQSNHFLKLKFLLGFLSLGLGPFLIPVVLLLDTVALAREIVLFIKHSVKLPGLKWLHPGYVFAFRVQRYVHAANFLGLSWVGLEGYEDMHNLVAAIFQSLPNILLKSVIFALGNKPSNGIFLSDGLFVTSVVASCLAMLKCLVMVLWQAYMQDISAFSHVSSLLAGKVLVVGQGERTLKCQSSNVDLLAQRYEVSGSSPLGA